MVRSTRVLPCRASRGRDRVARTTAPSRPRRWRVRGRGVGSSRVHAQPYFAARVARPAQRVSGARPAARGGPQRGEPGAGRARGPGGRQDGAAASTPSSRRRICASSGRSGVESEMELAFAGLHQLCAPMLDRLERLPGPQRDALATAFGLSAGHAPDRFLVGLAVLSLLSEVAEDRPLLCLVDDAQWLDRASAQALGLRRAPAAGGVGRRRLRGRASRSDERELEGTAGARASTVCATVMRARCCARSIRGPLDDRVRDRIVAETRGNPLALLELPRGLTPAELAGGFGLPHARPLAGRIEEQLPAAARRASGGTAAAAAASRRPSRPATRRCVWRAAERLGIGVGAASRRDRGRPARVRRARAVPASARALGRLPGGSAGGPPARPSRRWRRRPTPRSTPIVARGIARRRRPGPTRTSRRSSSAPPAGRSAAAASPPRPRSWSARPR